MKNKELNPKNNWDTNSYQNNHNFVWKYADNLVEILSPKPGEQILDLGCGTGQLTQKIADAKATVIGIDNSPEMITEARKNYPNLEFEVVDAKKIAFSETFDAVFSNAVLHWIKPPETVISNVWQVLKPDGRFVAEFGGKGNVESILAAINSTLKDCNYSPNQDNPWYFPSISEYATLLEKQGFCVTYAELFDRPTPLNEGEKGLGNWLKMFANSLFAEIPVESHPALINKIEQKLRSKLFKDNCWFADYKRLRIVALK